MKWNVSGNQPEFERKGVHKLYHNKLLSSIHSLQNAFVIYNLSAGSWESILQLVLQVIDPYPDPDPSLFSPNWIAFQFQFGAQQLRYITHLKDSSFDSAFFDFAAPSWKWKWEFRFVSETEAAVADFRATATAPALVAEAVPNKWGEIGNNLGVISRFLKLKARWSVKILKPSMAATAAIQETLFEIELIFLSLDVDLDAKQNK